MKKVLRIIQYKEQSIILQIKEQMENGMERMKGICLLKIIINIKYKV